MSERVQNLAQAAASGLKTRWPMEDMLGADLVAAIARRIDSGDGMSARIDAVDASLWLRVDSFSLMQSLAYLAARLRQEFDVAPGRAAPVGGRRPCPPGPGVARHRHEHRDRDGLGDWTRSASATSRRR